MKFIKKFESFKIELDSKIDGYSSLEESISVNTTKDLSTKPVFLDKVATAEDVASRFINLLRKEGEDIKKYTER